MLLLEGISEFFWFFHFIFYLHHRLLDRPEAQFAFGTSLQVTFPIAAI